MMQVAIGIVLACLLLPSMMTALGISELPVSFVAQAMSAACVAMLQVGQAACGVPARRALRITVIPALGTWSTASLLVPPSSLTILFVTAQSTMNAHRLPTRSVTTC
jgi:hypothetical protein